MTLYAYPDFTLIDKINLIGDKIKNQLKYTVGFKAFFATLLADKTGMQIIALVEYVTEAKIGINSSRWEDLRALEDFQNIVKSCLGKDLADEYSEKKKNLSNIGLIPSIKGIIALN